MLYTLSDDADEKSATLGEKRWDQRSRGLEDQSRRARDRVRWAASQPGNLEARTALELAVAYLDLVEALAQERGQEIRFTGLQIKDKCAAITTTTSAPKLTKDIAIAAKGLILIEAPASVSPRIAERARRVRRALIRMPEAT